MIDLLIGIALISAGVAGLFINWSVCGVVLSVLVPFGMCVAGLIMVVAGIRAKTIDRSVVMIEGRDASVDALRGLAIFTMAAANLAPFALAQPHPFLFRFYGTFAAPLFITISGMMVVYTTRKKSHNLNYFLLRGLGVVAVGVFVDVVVWWIYPFMTVDVLYLIGVSLPVAYLFQFLEKQTRWLFMACLFFAAPLLQALLGYTSCPTSYYLWGSPTLTVPDPTSVLNHWLIDGYFPIFPWLGFSFFGVNLGKLRWRKKTGVSFNQLKVLILGSGLLAAGAILWFFYPGSLLTREGYSELFYPPALGYIVTTIGLILILFFLVDLSPGNIVLRPLRMMGELALALYVLHLIIIHWIVATFWAPQPFVQFVLIYIALVVLLFVAARRLKQFKSKQRKRSTILRFLLSG